MGEGGVAGTGGRGGGEGETTYAADGGGDIGLTGSRMVTTRSGSPASSWLALDGCKHGPHFYNFVSGFPFIVEALN